MFHGINPTALLNINKFTPISVHLEVWQLLPNVSYWVLQTIAKGYRIQLNSHFTAFQWHAPHCGKRGEGPNTNARTTIFFEAKRPHSS